MIPKKFKLGAHTYKVLFPYVFSDSPEFTGQHDTGLREIKVRGVSAGGGKQAETNVFQVFLHEVIHAIDHTYCMGMIGSDTNGESLIDGISEGLSQFLLDNNFWKVENEDF